jgi:hypothetical protein
MDNIFTRMKRLLKIYIVFCCILPCVAVAQDERSVECRILTFERAGGVKKLQLLSDKKKLTKVDMHKNNFSGPYKIKGSVLFFYNEVTKIEDLKHTPTVAKVALPASLGNRVLLIALVHKGKYEFIPMKDSYESFNNGQIRMINLTSKVIGAMLNQKSVMIKPGKMHLWKKISTQKKKAHEYPAEFYTKDKEKFKIFSSGYWQYRPDVRKYSFLYNDPKSGRIRIKSIADYPTESEATPAE